MIGDRKERRKFLPSHQRGELSEDIFWSGTDKEEDICNTSEAGSRPGLPIIPDSDIQ
jgi:hypothetical protein